MVDKRQLPSEKAEQKKLQRTQIDEEKRQREEMLRGAFARIAQTDDGVIVLRWFMQECGWGRPPIVANPATGEINEKSSLYQSFRQSIWWKVRQFLPFNLLKEVEYED